MHTTPATPATGQNNHISLMRPEDVRHWTGTLDISFESLRRVVDEVGTSLDSITAALQKRRALCRGPR